MRTVLVLFLLARSSAGQYLTPSQYVNQGMGVMYSIGIGAFCCDGNENAAPVPPANSFNPSALNLDNWLRAAVNGGAKYVVLTTKYHEGFTLWPRTFAVPGFAPYDIAHSTWYAANGNYDLVGNFTTKARALGLNVVLYYSVLDHNFEAQCGCTASSNPSEYLAMVKADLNDLLTKYGSITAIWFDGWYWAIGGYSNIPFGTIYSFVHSLQPQTLVYDNNHLHPSPGDIDIYESAVDGLPPAGNTRLSEFNIGIQKSSMTAGNGTVIPDYSYVVTDGASTFDPNMLAQRWRTSIGNDASFLVNFGPDLTGNLDPTQLNTFNQTIADFNAAIGGGTPPSSVGPSASAYNSGTQTLAAGTNTPLSFDSNQWDTCACIHSTSVNPSRFLAPAAGYYQVTCVVQIGNVNTQLAVSISVNGPPTAPALQGGSPTSTFNVGSASGIIKLNPGDYAQCNAYVNSGVTTLGSTAIGQMTKLM